MAEACEARQSLLFELRFRIVKSCDKITAGKTFRFEIIT